MAMLYISHADPTERLARIERVKQGIAENLASSYVHLTRITKELDKGKGHVFSYTELMEAQHCIKPLQIAAPLPHRDDNNEGVSETSGSMSSAWSEPIIRSGFQLGPSTEGRVSESIGVIKSQRRRPQSWKRRNAVKPLRLPAPPVHTEEVEPSSSSKRKAIAPLHTSENKNKKISEPTVASILKPLPSQ
ncbi:hypothetical protein YC2023_064807 [Brassica napus]